MSSRLRGRSGRLAAVLLVALTTTLAGCSKDVTKPATSLPIGTVVPDFQLQDVNPNSVTTGQAVSPRSHLGQVSAWYFAHAT